MPRVSGSSASEMRQAVGGLPDNTQWLRCRALASPRVYGRGERQRGTDGAGGAFRQRASGSGERVRVSGGLLSVSCRGRTDVCREPSGMVYYMGRDQR